ncbi:hypothetical protein AWF08_00790 [Escherichia coli]|nr:hypothetical protein AWF08_00790 [Escherichia coli]
MSNLKSRFRTKTNASIISIFQRFSDISIMIITLYSLCVINHLEFSYKYVGNDSNLLIVFYVQIMPDDFVMQLHRF